MSVSRSISLAVLRGLLRAARKLDKDPKLRAFIQINRDDQDEDHRLAKLTSQEMATPKTDAPGQQASPSELLRAWMGGGDKYVPAIPTPRSATDAVLKEWRKASSAQVGSASSSSTQGNLPSGDDVFRVLRTLGRAVGQSHRSESASNHEAGEAKDFSITAESTLCIRKGNLLVAHPMLRGSFSRQVVLVCDHHDERGTYGLVISKNLKGAELRDIAPSLRHVKGNSKKNEDGDAVGGNEVGDTKSHSDEEIEGDEVDFPENLQGNSISWGGPVPGFQILHSVPDTVGGGVEVVPGLYCGGKLDRFACSKTGNDNDDDDVFIESTSLRCFVGEASWFPGQLQRELSEGTWFMTEVDYDKNAQFWQMLISDTFLTEADDDCDEDGVVEKGEDPNAKPKAGHGVHSAGMWRTVLRSMGGEYSSMAALPCLDAEDD
mmetsp:Transcript_10498/g.26638  ORF Transcript_10498/g.26638 Transcript_10498/m.26638 type:complete len:433 (-) Transcript_10498:171-1469(-)